MFFLWSLLLIQVAWQVHAQSALDDYVNAPDDTYSYTFLGSYRDDVRGLTVFDLNMTSQTWFDETFSSQPVWFHYMAMIVPDEVRYTSDAVLFISWRNNDDGPPREGSDEYLPLVMNMAAQSGMVCTLLNQIPNQPIVFTEDPKQMVRVEDDIIAFTWKKFALIDNGTDPNVHLLFPMTKAAIRAMDTVQDATSFLGLDIEHFFLAGGSKRALTSYLAAAVDPQDRVNGIMPLVFTALNMPESFMRHYQSMGGWSFAFAPYYNEDLTPILTEPMGPFSMSFWDPYTFRNRLTMPKLIVSGAGDEFFFGHETHIWWNDLPGQNYYWMLENTNHFLLGHLSRIVDNAVTFVTSIIEGYELPTLAWERIISADGTTGTLVLRSNMPPDSVTRWTGTTTGLTSGRRDFRLFYLSRFGVTPNPVAWFSEDIQPNADGEYSVTFDIPESGWRGFYLSTVFTVPNGQVFETTTEVFYLPEEFYVPPCEGAECTGQLV